MRNSQFFVRSFDFSSTKLVTKHFSATKKRWKTYSNRFFEVFCRENTEIPYAFCKLGDLRLHDKFMDTWLFCEGNTTGMCTQNTSGLTKTFCQLTKTTRNCFRTFVVTENLFSFTKMVVFENLYFCFFNPKMSKNS